MTEIDLDALEALANAATPGPWDVEPHDHLEIGCRCLSCYDTPAGWLVKHDAVLSCDEIIAKREAETGKQSQTCEDLSPLLTFADATFAAQARTFVPELIAEVRLLREQRDRVLALCGAYDNHEQPHAWQLARKVEAAYAAAEQPCPAGCPHPYRSHGPDGCRARVAHCDVCACQEPGSAQPAPAEGGN